MLKAVEVSRALARDRATLSSMQSTLAYADFIENVMSRPEPPSYNLGHVVGFVIRVSSCLLFHLEIGTTRTIPEIILGSGCRIQILVEPISPSLGRHGILK